MNSENSDVIYRSSPEKILNGVRSDSSKKVNKKTINFTPVYSSDKIMKNSNKNFLSFSNYTQNELESNEDDKQINFTDDSSQSILVPKRNISTKNLDNYNDSFDEIIKNLSSLPLSKKKNKIVKENLENILHFIQKKKIQRI